MKVLAADDELHARKILTDALQKALPQAEIIDFGKPSQVLAYAQEHPVELAFLDINTPDMSGLELAEKLRAANPRVNIIFVTGYDEYAREALSFHASGYIMKPVTPEKILREMADLRYPLSQPLGTEEAQQAPAPRETLLRLQCFGNFDVFDSTGHPVRFDRSKAKELLAYLTFRNGASCTTREIAGILFEDAVYDHRQKSYTQLIISSMLRGLKAVGAEGAITRSYNSMALDVKSVDCDYYRYVENSATYGGLYTGEFMVQYSWAESVAGYLDHKEGLI